MSKSNTPTRSIKDIESLIQMLRKNGVYYYKSPELEMHIKPAQEIVTQEKAKEDEEALFWSAN